MSRIRSVHPGFFRDDRLVPCSAFARLLFIGLGVEADDKGIFEWKPVTLKMSIFPGDNIDIAALLAELVEADAIRQFEVAGKRYGAIRNFRKYQKPKTPNDVHPMADGISEYVSLPPKVETDAAERAAFPQNGENRFQMEDGGGVEEDEKESPPSPPEGDARRLYDALVGFYPSTPNTKARNAERLFLKLSPDEQRLTIPAAKAAADAARQDRQKRGRSLEEHWGFIPGLDTWLREGRWKALPAAPSGPVTLMTKLDRELDADLWKACEQVMGKKAPTSGLTWSFDNAVIEQARQVAA